MSCSKLADVVLVIATPACTAIPVGCPGKIQVAGRAHAFADARVFQGPPADAVEIAAFNGRWDDLGEMASTGGGKRFILICRYAGTPDLRSIALPSGVRACDGEFEKPRKTGMPYYRNGATA